MDLKNNWDKIYNDTSKKKCSTLWASGLLKMQSKGPKDFTKRVWNQEL